MKVFTDANFDHDVLGADEPVIVDFWSTNCGSACDDSLQELGSLEPLYPNITFGSLETIANPITPTRYNVTMLPTLILFKDGEEAGRIDGPATRAQMIDLLNSVLVEP